MPSSQIFEQELNSMEMDENCCIICGANVEKNNALRRYGECYCSEEHAQAYADMIQSDCGCC